MMPDNTYPLKQNKTEVAYIPGQCNIGPDEVRKRMRIGYIGLGLMVLFVFLTEMYNVPQVWKLALMAPAAYALSGFLQAFQRFCFLFGFFGLFSVSGKRSKVYDNEQQRKDRMKALRLIFQVVSGSMLITLLYYFLS